MADIQPAATASAGDPCDSEVSNGASMDQDNTEKQGIKRPAEQQIGPDDVNKDFKAEEPGEFPKADDDVIAQRAVFAPVSTMGEDDDNASDAAFGRPVFKLNPPTLIHGQAKSAPKSDDEEKENEEKPLLRPSSLNHHNKGEEGDEKASLNPIADGAHNINPFTLTENNGEADNEAYKRTKIFLPFTMGDTKERDLGFGVFGKFRDSSYRVGFQEQDGRGGANAANSSSANSAETEHDGKTHENYFTQFTSQRDKDLNSSGDSPSSLSSSSGSSFLFGQNMNERVTSPNRQEGELQSAGEFVFGQNLSARIKTDGFNETSPEKPKEQTLAENANALEEARERMRRKFEDVESVTGEEDEENVVQSHCKLFVFDNVKKNWLERGRGQIRLNDSRQSSNDSAFQSRLVMRTQGSLRLILNTKIWSEMTVEKATTRNLRISAMDAESETVKVFLITGAPKDIEQLYCAIEYRVQALKHVQLEEKQRSEVEEGQTGAQDTKAKDGDYEEDEDLEDGEDDDEDDDEDSEVAKICSRDRSKPTSPKSTEGNSASASPSLHVEDS